MPGVNWQLSPEIPDLGIERWEPCSAVTSLNTVCGATPTAQYRKTCGVAAHELYLWLCPVHAAIVASGGAICKQCADAGGVIPVKITRLTGPIRAG